STSNCDGCGIPVLSKVGSGSAGLVGLCIVTMAVCVFRFVGWERLANLNFASTTTSIFCGHRRIRSVSDRANTFSQKSAEQAPHGSHRQPSWVVQKIVSGSPVGRLKCY